MWRFAKVFCRRVRVLKERAALAALVSSSADARRSSQPTFGSVAAALVATAALLAPLSGCGSSAAKPTSATNSSATAASYRAEATLSPPTAAPPLRLRNYLGQPVDIAQYRGKPVLVTFIYTRCPDVCPLITSNLRVAQNLLGADGPSKAQVIAVSVDARGDNRATVAAF